jgi:hypothetical protein
MNTYTVTFGSFQVYNVKANSPKEAASLIVQKYPDMCRMVCPPGKDVAMIVTAS